MTKPLIISFFTKNTPYEREIQSLQASLKAFHLEHFIEGIENLGSWEKNCCYKPLFIQRCLEKFNRPLLWIDADAVVMQEPSAASTWEFDFGTRVNIDLGFDHLSKCITNTIFLRPTEKSFHILSLWIERCNASLANALLGETIMDQNCLKEALLEKGIFDWVTPLPLSYAAIIDEEQKEEPVILHHQASRTFRNFIDQTIHPALLGELSSLDGDALKNFRKLKP